MKSSVGIVARIAKQRRAPARRLIVAAIVSAAVALAACGGGDDDDTPAADDTEAPSGTPAAGDTDATGPDGTADSGDTGSAAGPSGTLKFSYEVATPTMDPALLPIQQLRIWLNPVYDALTYVTLGDAEPAPMLATEWVSGSDATGDYLDMTLREGLTFADGAPFGADTVVANIERSQTLEGSQSARFLVGVTVEKVSDSVVRFRSETGLGALPTTLGGPAGMMISQQALADGADLSTKAYGIGPWTLEEFTPNRSVYKATPSYWDPAAQGVETLEMVLVEGAKLNALRSGDVDVTFLTPAEIGEAEDAGLVVDPVPGLITYGFSFNTAIPPLDNPDVRKAIAQAINRDAIGQELLEGRCEPTVQMLAPTWWAANPDITAADLPYDVDAARAAIEEAGADGAKIRLVTTDVVALARLSTIVQSQLAEIGLDVEVETMPSAQSVEIFGARKEAGMIFVVVGTQLDPSEVVATFLMPGALINPGGFEIPEIETLATEGVQATATEERAPAYNQIFEGAYEGMTTFTVCSPELIWAMSPKVQGFVGAGSASAGSVRGVTVSD